MDGEESRGGESYAFLRWLSIIPDQVTGERLGMMDDIVSLRMELCDLFCYFVYVLG